MRLNSFKYLCGQGTKNLWFNRVNSFASLCIVTVSLLMVGMSVLVAANISRMIGSIESRNELIVVIEDGTPDNNIAIMGEQIAEIDNISEVSFYSKEEAWEEMQVDMSDDEKALFKYMDTNPLPDSYKVRVEDIGMLNETVQTIDALEFTELVKAPNDFASLLTSIRNVCAILFSAITIALVIVCLVIVYNTTRTSVYARRKEIHIMRYVGATKTFVKIPFFVEGAIIGLLSSLLAFGLTWLAYHEIFNMLSSDFNLWNIFGISGLIPFGSIAVYTLLAYIAAGIILSTAGTVISTQKHLNV